MKKSILIALLLALTVASAGCSKTSSDDKSTGGGTSVSDTAKTENNESGNTDDSSAENNEDEDEAFKEALENFAVDADKNVDMDAIDGEYAQVSDEATGDSSQKLGDYDVAIKEAKVFNYADIDFIVFTIDFKNNSSVETTFSSVIEAHAFQDGLQIAPGSIPESLEGLDTDTTAQRVPAGKKITVQKLYALTDTTTPVEIQLRAFHEDTDAFASQIFDIQ